jgi:hypothetical protein
MVFSNNNRSGGSQTRISQSTIEKRLSRVVTPPPPQEEEERDEEQVWQHIAAELRKSYSPLPSSESISNSSTPVIVRAQLAYASPSPGSNTLTPTSPNTSASMFSLIRPPIDAEYEDAEDEDIEEDVEQFLRDETKKEEESSVESKMNHSDRVMKEFIETEKTYCEGLDIIVNVRPAIRFFFLFPFSFFLFPFSFFLSPFSFLFSLSLSG